ncbi:MAG: carbohydrate kinase [Roseiflexaceae bacterium]|nr:carbohydrate kinase [Roseiflexaceae bacterium]
MDRPYTLGIDQGSSGSRALVLDADGRALGYGYQSVPRHYPRPGWVEQRHDEIAGSVATSIHEAMAHAQVRANQVAAIGITTQRDTVFAWDAATLQPIGNAITWQDLRTVALVEEVNLSPLAGQRRERLGQFPGAYASAMHMAWRMRHDPAFRAAADAGRLQVSLAAGWIVRALGASYDHALDYSLMQAMTVFDFRYKRLWDEWIEYLDIPRAALPRAVPTNHAFGEIELTDAFGGRALVPVLAMITDQQAALFGHDCRRRGEAACTHGTASFVNVVVGSEPPPQGTPKVYLGWELGGVPTYCLEADTTVTGAVIRWMQEQMGWIARSADLGPLAASVPDSAGVVFAPAFTGFGVPLEDRTARGTLLGLTLDTSPAHIARAFLESIGYQLRDILDCMRAEAGLDIQELKIGGGISASELACQLQADVLGIPVRRSSEAETGVRAAALLAGLGAGVWPQFDALPPLGGESRLFEPDWSQSEREARLAHWHRAVERARGWA